MKTACKEGEIYTPCLKARQHCGMQSKRRRASDNNQKTSPTIWSGNFSQSYTYLYLVSVFEVLRAQ